MLVQYVFYIHDTQTIELPCFPVQRDTLKMMFEALKNRREQEELGTIAYPLPAHLITRSNRGHNIVGELHHHSHETTEHQQQDLKHSVSVRGMASGHSINQSSKVCAYILSPESCTYSETYQKQRPKLLSSYVSPHFFSGACPQYRGVLYGEVPQCLQTEAICTKLFDTCFSVLFNVCLHISKAQWHPTHTTHTHTHTHTHI